MKMKSSLALFSVNFSTLLTLAAILAAGFVFTGCASDYGGSSDHADHAADSGSHSSCH